MIPISKSKHKNIGKYDNEYVIFDREINKSWSVGDTNEYYNNNSGYYRNWSYDLKSKIVRNQLFEWIEEIPEEKRTKIEVIRHLMTYMSSIMIGKWDDDFEDGYSPVYWNGTEQIFTVKNATEEPVKYGQCWCFAEIMTSLCRMLNIPTRTVSGTNVLIDENSDHGIDFHEDLRKGEQEYNLALISKDSLNQSLSNLISNGDNKAEPWEDLRIYDCGDTFWSIHYWNEVHINGNWYAFDSTPAKVGFTGIGPYSILKEDGYDSDKIISMINLPFRLWTFETIIEGDKTINIPYVYSIIYPHSERKSKYLNLHKIVKIFDKKVKVLTKHSNFPLIRDINITSNYLISDIKLSELYYSDSPLEGNFYIQIVHLNSLGNVLHIDRIFSSITDMKDKESIINDTYLKSYLLIENVEKGINQKWFTFMKYS